MLAMLAANLTLEKLKVKNSWRAHLYKLKSLGAEGKRNGSGRRRFFPFASRATCTHVTNFYPPATENKLSLGDIFFWVPQSPKIKSWKKFSQPTNKNWKQLSTKNSQHGDMMLCLQNENSSQKNCQRLESTLDFFYLAPLTIVNV